jgi:hypothetical protein
MRARGLRAYGWCFSDPKGLLMTESTTSRLGWLDRWRERRRLKRERTGNSPENVEERHTPKGDAVDLMLKAGGVERESRFKR